MPSDLRTPREMQRQAELKRIKAERALTCEEERELDRLNAIPTCYWGTALGDR